jgi:hypothetical protein
MKAALRARFTIAIKDVPESILQQWRGEPRYFWVKIPQPFRQDGQDFLFIVAQFKLINDVKFEQRGAGVLCQTEDEAKEAFNNLNARSKGHAVVVQWPGFGHVAWATNIRRFVHEIGVFNRNLSDGKMLWIAIERETDQDTLEVKVINRREAETQGEANYWADKWQAEYLKEKKSHFEHPEKNIMPPVPSHCVALTKTDIEDLGKAKMIALQKQWPRCFEIFEKTKSNPNLKIPDQEIEDAYVLDLVGNGCDVGMATGGKKIRPDMQLISSLHKSAENYAKRGKSKIIDSAIYLIAFNWELGWCYLSDEQLAEKLCEILETNFTAGQVHQYRYRTLGLVAKHLPGLPPKSP